ncbi:MAG: efflux RND transporter periplasmic adaptor subunit [Oscillospiraceae bacterium]|nr:efflux RND transporter periplasmic adaptor subunit [Oscillospiraceae bacterium]
MKMKKSVLALGAAVLLMLTGCGGKPQIDVEQASMLTTAVTSSDKFAGVVVSENVIEIDRDTEQKLDELYVAVGDVVRVNEKLFEYDTDSLSLTVDKQQLEMDKLTQQIKDLTTQKTNLEKQIKKEKDKNTKATLELTLRSVTADLTQANYDKKTLQAEINYNKDMLKDAVVRSPIKGVVRSIDENGSPYITIQQDGAFQVKGSLNELSLNAGIMEGVGVTILSRTDPTAFWTGTVTLVDYNTTEDENSDNMFGGYVDPMASSTSYPFYITLDSTDGLLLGQHVYIQISAAGIGDELLRIPEGYIQDIATDEETWMTTGYVWGVDMETMTLVKLPVTLGEYDPTYGTYVILDGITPESFLADPADKGVKEGASVYLRSELEYAGQTEPTESVPFSDPTGSTGDNFAADTTDGGMDDSGFIGESAEDPDKVG